MNFARSYGIPKGSELEPVDGPRDLTLSSPIRNTLTYGALYRSINAVIRKLTFFTSKCRFSSRADSFLRRILTASSYEPCTFRLRFLPLSRSLLK